MKPKRHKHFSAGNKYANSLHCRLRVGRIFFNSHGFAIILTTSDKCSFCNKAETVKHHFFCCSKFKDQQNILFSSILQIFPEFANKSIENKLQVLLYGIFLNAPEPDPRNGFFAFRVQDYILQTGRFSKTFKPGPFQPPPGFPPLKKQLRKKQQEQSYLVHFLVVGGHADECPAQAQSAKKGGD